MAIHPTAIVDKQAHIPASADLGPHAVIEGPVKLGEHVKVYPNAYLSGWTEIGDRCVIHPGAIVGHLPQDFHFSGERSFCRIGAGTIIREFSSIHRGTQPGSCTILGENCFILAYAHVGHNCELGNGVKVYNCAALSGHVEVGDNSIVSGYSLVHQFARIGEYVMVGGGVKITKDIPPYMKIGNDGLCAGYNGIGLKRSEKFTREEVEEVRNAYRTLMRTRLPLSAAVAQFTPQVKTRTGRRILEFIGAPSKLGIISGRMAGDDNDKEGEE